VTCISVVVSFHLLFPLEDTVWRPVAMKVLYCGCVLAGFIFIQKSLVQHIGEKHQRHLWHIV
jgi:hypothetical protein